MEILFLHSEPCLRAHVFIDAGYVLERFKQDGRQAWPDPCWFGLIGLDLVKFWGARELHAVTRLAAYDAFRELGAGEDDSRHRYWAACEAKPDCEVKHGFLKERTKKKGPKQVGVDVQLAVDLVVGAYSGIYDIAILVAGDDDFYPAVYEARRRGVCVALVSFASSVGESLVEACDRVKLLDLSQLGGVPGVGI